MWNALENHGKTCLCPCRSGSLQKRSKIENVNITLYREHFHLPKSWKRGLPRWPFGGPLAPRGPPKGPPEHQGPFRTLLGPIWDPFGTRFGPILDPFWIPFEQPVFCILVYQYTCITVYLYYCILVNCILVYSASKLARRNARSDWITINEHTWNNVPSLPNLPNHKLTRISSFKVLKVCKAV